MHTLIIDTSTTKVIFALSQEDNLIDSMELEHRNQLSKNFYSYLQSFLEKNRCPLHHIERFAAGIGPGSYTGTRIAIAAGKSLAFSLQKPLIGFCSLKAFLPCEESPFLIVAESKYSTHFVLRGERKGNILDLNLLGFLSFEELASRLAEHHFLFGNFSHAFLEKLLRFFPISNIHALQFNPRLMAEAIHKTFSSPSPSAEQEISALYFSSP